jgi:hypothetical protein
MCTAPTQDPNSAISLYNGYCANINVVLVPTTTVTTGTGGTTASVVGSTKTTSVPGVTAMATTGSAGAKTGSAGTSNGVGRLREWVFGAFGLTLAFIM